MANSCRLKLLWFDEKSLPICLSMAGWFFLITISGCAPSAQHRIMSTNYFKKKVSSDILSDAQISKYLVTSSYNYRRGEETTLTSIWMWITSRYVHSVSFHDCFTLTLHTFLSLHHGVLGLSLNPNTFLLSPFAHKVPYWL